MLDLKNLHQDTIVAQATAPGQGGVGIVRLSGKDALRIGQAIIKRNPTPRHAHYGGFYDVDDTMLDEGIALYFPGPHSFTGEDIVELQGHGGPIVISLLIELCVKLGARLARAGEFSERAFFNDKMDLTQAEAIADLISSTSEQAARSALRSLQGAFSTQVNALVESLIELRIYVEAAIDFPEEEIDFLSDGKVTGALFEIEEDVARLIKEAGQGALLRDGMEVAIAGRPNAGKSSLMNVLAGKETAIVTDIEGTTRDILKEHIHIDGMPLHVIDTAGLRETEDKVEQIGVARASAAIENADRILLMVDSTAAPSNTLADLWPPIAGASPAKEKITIVRNKIDLSGETANVTTSEEGVPVIHLSTTTEAGVDHLKDHLKACMGYEGSAQSTFSARRRHVDALRQAQTFITHGREQLEFLGAGELLAEDLKEAQKALGEITGAFSSDDLLGRIFTSFCIGK